METAFFVLFATHNRYNGNGNRPEGFRFGLGAFYNMARNLFHASAIIYRSITNERNIYRSFSPCISSGLLLREKRGLCTFASQHRMLLRYRKTYIRFVICNTFAYPRDKIFRISGLYFFNRNYIWPTHPQRNFFSVMPRPKEFFNHLSFVILKRNYLWVNRRLLY